MARTAGKYVVKFVLSLLFPLVPFLFLYFKSKNSEEFFEDVLNDSIPCVFKILAYTFLFLAFTVKLADILLTSILLNRPLLVGNFWNNMDLRYEIDIILFVIYVQLLVIFSILVFDVFRNSIYPYLVELGKKGQL